jgi:gas vesicle protein
MAKQKTPIWAEIGAAAVGAAVGGVLGMLFSPKSGKENRKTVVKKSRAVAASATRVAKQVEKTSSKAVSKGVKKVAATAKKVQKARA